MPLIGSSVEIKYCLAVAHYGVVHLAHHGASTRLYKRGHGHGHVRVLYYMRRFSVAQGSVSRWR